MRVKWNRNLDGMHRNLVTVPETEEIHCANRELVAINGSTDVVIDLNKNSMGNGVIANGNRNHNQTNLSVKVENCDKPHSSTTASTGLKKSDKSRPRLTSLLSLFKNKDKHKNHVNGDCDSNCSSFSSRSMNPYSPIRNSNCRRKLSFDEEKYFETDSRRRRRANTLLMKSSIRRSWNQLNMHNKLSVTTGYIIAKESAYHISPSYFSCHKGFRNQLPEIKLPEIQPPEIQPFEIKPFEIKPSEIKSIQNEAINNGAPQASTQINGSSFGIDNNTDDTNKTSLNMNLHDKNVNIGNNNQNMINSDEQTRNRGHSSIDLCVNSLVNPYYGETVPDSVQSTIINDENYKIDDKNYKINDKNDEIDPNNVSNKVSNIGYKNQVNYQLDKSKNNDKNVKDELENKIDLQNELGLCNHEDASRKHNERSLLFTNDKENIDYINHKSVGIQVNSCQANHKNDLKQEINNELNEESNEGINKESNKESNEKSNKEINEDTNKEINEETNGDSNSEINRDSNSEINRDLNLEINRDLNEESSDIIKVTVKKAILPDCEIVSLPSSASSSLTPSPNLINLSDSESNHIVSFVDDEPVSTKNVRSFACQTEDKTQGKNSFVKSHRIQGILRTNNCKQFSDVNGNISKIPVKTFPKKVHFAENCHQQNDCSSHSSGKVRVKPKSHGTIRTNL